MMLILLGYLGDCRKPRKIHAYDQHEDARAKYELNSLRFLYQIGKAFIFNFSFT